MTTRRSGKLLVFACMCCMLCACWRSRRLEPPDLTPQRVAAQNASQRYVQILEVMSRDVSRLKSLSSDLISQPIARYEAPFPLQTFRLTAMTCLHESMGAQGVQDDASLIASEMQDLPESAAEASARRFGVTCVPDALPVFEEKLDALDSNAHYAFGREQLGRVESIRVLRQRLRTRQAKITPILNESRAQLTQQQKALQRVMVTVDAQRLDYAPGRLKQVREDIDAQSKRLDAWRESLKTLRDAQLEWPDEINHTIDALVYELAWVGQPRLK